MGGGYFRAEGGSFVKTKLCWLIAGLLALALTSCGVFFAPLEGRWNPNDDKFGDGYVEKTLYPTLDGYVILPSGSDFGTNPIMQLAGDKRALLKFDSSAIPKDIFHAELRLYSDSLISPPNSFQVKLILQDWDASVTYVQATNLGFLALLTSPSVSVSIPGYYSWDVTTLVRSVSPSSMKGLLVDYLSGMGPIANFRSTDNVANRPYLAIWAR